MNQSKKCNWKTKWLTKNINKENKDNKVKRRKKPSSNTNIIITPKLKYKNTLEAKLKKSNEKDDKVFLLCTPKEKVKKTLEMVILKFYFKVIQLLYHIKKK